MSDNTPTFAASRQQLNLGPEVCRCRRLSAARALRSQGFALGWFIGCVLYPFVLLPVIALIPTMMVFFILGYSVEEMVGALAALGLVFFCFYLLSCWVVFAWPRSDYLVLHEQGLRVCLGFQRLQSPFAAIARVFIGGARPQLEAGVKTGAALGKPQDWRQSLAGSALTLVMKDGKIHVFKALLTQFEAADLEKFFQEFLKRNPHLAADEDEQKSFPD